MLLPIPYRRWDAVTYAHRWAYSRNPKYYDYDNVGGDCTNFASQCLYAGTGVMNETPVFGWYYFDANHKAPAWSGVQYFYNFVTRKEKSAGPYGVETEFSDLLPGDFVQLKLHDKGKDYSHTPIVVAVGDPPTLGNILVAAHTYDVDYRPINTYPYLAIRFLHILGAYLPQP